VINNYGVLTPQSSLLSPHSSVLTPQSSLLSPHSSVLRRENRGNKEYLRKNKEEKVFLSLIKRT